MAEQKLDLDILVVTCGRWEQTEKTLSSLLDTLPLGVKPRFVIIDNASPDDTPNKVKNYFNSVDHAQLDLVEIVAKVKSYEAVNESFARIKADYVLRTDNDIDYKPGWFEECKKILDTVPGMALVCPTNHYRQAEIQQKFPPNQQYLERSESGAEYYAYDLAGRNIPGNFLTRKEYVKFIGPMYTAFDLLNTDAYYCTITVHSGLRYCATKEVMGWHLQEPKSEYYNVKANKWHQDINTANQIRIGNVAGRSNEEVSFVRNMDAMLANWPARKREGVKQGLFDCLPKEFNILIPSVGRRVELVREFKEILSMGFVKGRVIGCGSNGYMPAAYECDQWVLTPEIKDAEPYDNAVLNICKDLNIAVVIPVIDYDCVAIARLRDRILASGTVPVCQNYEIAKATFDKQIAAEYFASKGMRHPQLLQQDSEYSGPVVVKPRFGFASKNIVFAESAASGWMAAKNIIVQNPIVQQRIEGVEYTVDLYINRNGEILSMCHRERVTTRGGEIQVGRVVRHSDVVEMEIEKIAGDFVGPINIQYIVDNDGVAWFIEINPRFGGGVPMTIEALQNQALLLIKEYSGMWYPKHLRYVCRNNLVGMRYDDATYKLM